MIKYKLEIIAVMAAVLVSLTVSVIIFLQKGAVSSEGYCTLCPHSYETCLGEQDSAETWGGRACTLWQNAEDLFNEAKWCHQTLESAKEDWINNSSPSDEEIEEVEDILSEYQDLCEPNMEDQHGPAEDAKNSATDEYLISSDLTEGTNYSQLNPFLLTDYQEAWHGFKNAQNEYAYLYEHYKDPNPGGLVDCVWGEALIAFRVLDSADEKMDTEIVEVPSCNIGYNPPQ